MWSPAKYTDRLPSGDRYDVELANSGEWVAYYVQTGGRKSLPIKQVDERGNKHDFATAFDAMVACDIHKRGLSMSDAMEDGIVRIVDNDALELVRMYLDIGEQQLFTDYDIQNMLRALDNESERVRALEARVVAMRPVGVCELFSEIGAISGRLACKVARAFRRGQ